MLIQAPWFIYELPKVNESYNNDEAALLSELFDSARYALKGSNLCAEYAFRFSREGTVAKHVAATVISGFKYHGGAPCRYGVELTIVTREGGFYRELPFPAPEGTPAWLLLTAFHAQGGAVTRWGGNDEIPEDLLSMLNNEQSVEPLLAFCDLVAAKLARPLTS